jgi:hypothetical protein
VAVSGPQKILLEAEFPELDFPELPGYGIRYAGGRGRLVPALIFRIPRILRSMRRENAWLKRYCREKKPDLIISDNRYGFYHKGSRNVFITHQLFIQTGLGKAADRLLLKLNRHFIGRFSVCWVPDLPPPHSLAGILSQPPRPPAVPVVYLGPLSRFSRQEKEPSNPLLIMISGPEPHRTAFEDRILAALAHYRGAAVLLRGLPGLAEKKILPGTAVEIYDHLASGPLNDLLNSSAAVICRSGYSTVMDLARLRRRAVLVPTPGQTEQEWLGRYLHEKKWAYCMPEESFDLEACLKAFAENDFGFPGLPDAPLSGVLSAALQEFNAFP